MIITLAIPATFLEGRALCTYIFVVPSPCRVDNTLTKFVIWNSMNIHPATHYAAKLLDRSSTLSIKLPRNKDSTCVRLRVNLMYSGFENPCTNTHTSSLECGNQRHLERMVAEDDKYN